MSQRRAPARLIVCLLVVLAYGCTGEGCDCLADLEEEFPIAAKQRAGLQVRLTDSGLRFISDNAFDLLSDQIGDTLTFDVPPNCSSDPSVCCGYPVGFCSMELDLKDYGEGSHIDVEALDSAGNRLGITIYPRVRTMRPMPARTYGPLGGAIDCNVEFNTRWAGTRWMWIYFEVVLGESSESGELGVTVSTAQVGGIASGDINIYGDFLCRFGSEQDAINGIAAGFRDQIPGAIEEFLCQSCDDDTQCGSGSSCDDGVCRGDESGQCKQSFEISGRHQAGDLLGPLLGQAVAKKLDLYFAAGSEAVSEDDGLSLAVTSGMQPAASPSEHGCVPITPEPTLATMTLADELRTNSHPVTGQSYDLGAAIHVDALNHGAWAAHQAGYICLNLGTQRVDNLTSDAMLLVAPSLGNVFDERSKQPMYVLVRPQTAPVITLGDGTFVEGPDDGPAEIDDPSIKIALVDLELDFYAFIDRRYARIFTVVADANLGVALEVDGDGGLLPVLDDPAGALSNIRAKNITFVAETEAEIAERIPSILGVALGGLSSELGDAIALPEVAGLGVSLSSGAFASVDNKSRVAMFADLAPGGSDTRQVETKLSQVVFDRPAGALTVNVSSEDTRAIEWQFRLGGGFWSPFTSKKRVTIQRASLTTADRHRLEVRARVINEPRTLDSEPELVEVRSDVALGDGEEPGDVIAFHGQGESAGCGECSSSGSGGLGASLLALMALTIAFGRRRLGLFFIVLAAGLAAGCSCGSDKEGESDPNDPNQVQPGPVGRWVSADGDSSRVVAAAYERARGDLVISELREDGEPRYFAVDGVPEGPVSRDPKGYRGGVEASGPDVGAWPSLRLISGEVIIAYQDRDRGALRLAYQDGDNFAFVDVDVPEGDAELGLYASLDAAADGTLGIAYLSAEVTDSVDAETVPTVVTELRYASAPSAAGPWTIEVVATATESHDARIDVHPGIGLWSSLAFSGEIPTIAFYDSVAGDLVVAEKREAAWTTTVVDAEGDRGQFAALAAGGPGELFVAYQDADADRLLLRRIASGDIGEVEVIDDGRRDGDRNHPVGASARIEVTDSELVVAYQDSAANMLVVARRPRDGQTWSRADSKLPGSGFAIGLAASGSVVWTADGVYEAGRGRLEARRW